MHPEDAAETFPLALGAVVDIIVGFNGAGVDTEESQLAYKGIDSDFKGQGGEGFFIRGVALHRDVVVFGAVALDGRDIHGAGHEVSDGVQQRLHTLVAVTGAAQYGCHLAGDGGFADGGFDFFFRQLFPRKVFLHQGVVGFRDRLQQFGAILIGQGLHIRGDVFLAYLPSSS